jgi:hypothetical protein
LKVFRTVFQGLNLCDDGVAIDSGGACGRARWLPTLGTDLRRFNDAFWRLLQPGGPDHQRAETGQLWRGFSSSLKWPRFNTGGAFCDGPFWQRADWLPNRIRALWQGDEAALHEGSFVQSDRNFRDISTPPVVSCVKGRLEMRCYCQ